MATSSGAELEEIEAGLAAAERVLRDGVGDGSPERQREVADALLLRADTFREVFHRRAALECADEVIARFGDTSDERLERRVISARRGRAAALLGLRRYEEGLREAKTVVAGAAGQVDDESRWSLASALMSQAGALMRLQRSAEAEQRAERLAREFAADPWQGPRRANMVGVGLLLQAAATVAQGRRPEAERLADEVIERFASEQEPSVRSLIVRATELKAQLARDKGQVDEALELRQRLVDQYDDATRPGLRDAVGDVAIAHAVALSKLGRTEEALGVLDRLLDRLDADRDPRVNPALELRGACLKALYLSRLKKDNEAIAAGDSVLFRYTEAPPPDIETELAELLRIKAGLLADTGRVTEAIAELDQIRDRFDEERLRPALVARALIKRSLLLRRANRPAEALSACRDIIDRFGNEPPPETPWVALDAFHEIPFALEALGRRRQAISACDELVQRFEPKDDLAVRVAVADILSYKAHLLGKRGRIRKTLKTLDAVVERTEGSTEPKLERLAKRAEASRRTILTQRSDARRLRIAMLAPLVIVALLTGGSLRIAKALFRPALSK